MNMMPHPNSKRQQNGVKPKPKNIRELFSYIFKSVSGFLSRLFFIISLVWQSAPMLLIVMALLCLLDGVLPIFGAYISRDLLNEIAKLIEQRASGTIASEAFVALKPLIFLFILNLVYLLAKRVLSKIGSMVTGISGELVVNHIKMMIINKSKTLDLRSFDSPEFYEKLENANREAGMRPIGILTATFNVISAVISAISFVVVLSGLHPLAPVIMIVVAIPGALVNYIYRNQNFMYIRRHSKERREMYYYSSLMVNKDMAKEIKILGLADTFISKYKNVFKKYYKGLKRLILKEGITQILIGLISVLVNSLLFVFIAYTVVFADGQVGDYSLYSGALTSISGYVTTLLTATATIYEGTLFIDNMITFMKEDVTITNGEGGLIPNRHTEHTIEFKNVSFAYPGTQRKILKNINLTINPNESAVLVGLNGAGKTTFIKLLTRLYDPTEGEILLDGHNLKEYDPAALYDMFGIIFQDFGKYAQTVSENISFGDINREYDFDNIVLAADEGNSKEFIDKLPMGFDTPLTRVFEEDGVELSGGQWQKLSVSRAFYKDSDILILDEPTASLDALAEKEVFDRFKELSNNKITVFVSHRLSSAVGASKIIVIDNGEIAEIGRHEELMSLKGKYYKLFSTQASRYTGIDYE